MMSAPKEESHAPDRYQELAYKLVTRESSSTLPRGAVIALVSPHPEAGVTHLTRNLECRMNTGVSEAAQLAITLDGRHIVDSGIPLGMMVVAKLGAQTLASELPEGVTLETKLNRLSGNWRNDPRHRSDCIEVMRGLFKLILIDCPSIKQSAAIFSIAPLVDGVIIVVEADRTTRRQLEYLSRTIRAARGCVLGYILNKRTYCIPNGLYRILERGGLA